MKKKLLSVLAGLACALGAYAVPAMPGLTKVMQPDGTYVSLELHGDEFFHYTTTADGYTVERNAAGYYVYVQKSADGVLKQSAQVAHDATSRGAGEVDFLKSVAPRLVDSSAANDARIKSAKANAGYAADGLSAKPKRYDYKNFRGLVILVEFNDRTFSRTDIKDVMTNMITQRHYQGVPDVNDPSKIIPYTGSVRDYFYDNSMGQFDPEFDVVGPVTVPVSQYYAMGTAKAHNLMGYAVDAARDVVNFSNYDRDDDGIVDMVYFVFAGYGSHVGGNNSQLIWPHKSSFGYKRVDGVYMGDYACSTEMGGSEGTTVLDGIGTICHEFSHVLGLADEYDTDYESGGGQSVHPGTWSVMAGGSYLNNARTPVGYSLFERYQAGFANPELITKEGDYSVRNIDVSNEGYRINSAVNKEFFLLENRRKSGWNAYGPGEGMLVFRVDSTSTSVWTSNRINCDPAHNYYELVRANPQTQYGMVADTEYDPFPGASGITELTNYTSPSTIKSWTGKNTKLVLKNISEDADGVIHFSVENGDFNGQIEDFEAIDAFERDSIGVQGEYAKWAFYNAAVADYGSSLGNGKRTVGLKKDGYIQTITEVSADKINAVSFKAWNQNTNKALRIHFYVSYDQGANWQEMYQAGSTAATVIAANKKDVELLYDINATQPILIKISVEGTITKPCSIDDVQILYTGLDLSGIDNVVADDSSSSFKVAVSGDIVSVMSDDNAAVEVYDASGMLVARANAVDGTASVQLPQAGFYIVRQGNNVKKIIR